MTFLVNLIKKIINWLLSLFGYSNLAKPYVTLTVGSSYRKTAEQVILTLGISQRKPTN
jgi:hypothetical protein